MKNYILSKDKMKNFKICILVFSFLYLTFLIFPSTIKAASVNMSGYAWSSNIGWISFSGAGYGVTVDDVTGNLSGYAWSSNIGWIKFDGLSGCPGTGSCDARINLSTKEFEGWARACAGTASGDCSNMNPRTDGWDGWISLNCNNTGSCGSSNFKWSLSSSAVTGYAWGDEVVGWVDGSYINTGLNIPTASLGVRVLGSGNSFTSISPFSINSGQDIELEWSSTGASSCVGSVTGDPAAGGFNTGGATSGTIGAPITEPSDGTSATYMVICSNIIGSDSAAITVQNLSTVVSLKAEPSTVNLTDAVDLVWNVGGNDPAFCEISGPNGYFFDLTGQPASGSVTGVTVYGESDFVLTCSPNGINPGASDTATVNISGDFGET